MDFSNPLGTVVERNIGTFNETVWAYMKDSAGWDDGRRYSPQQRKMNEQTLAVTHPLGWQYPWLSVTSVRLVTCKTNLFIYHDCQNTFSATVSVISYALLVLKACVSVTLIKRSFFKIFISTNMLYSDHYNPSKEPQYWSNSHWWPLKALTLFEKKRASMLFHPKKY